MRISGREITDECSRCGNILDCELFVKGHGIHGKRCELAKLVECQLEHKKERTKHEEYETMCSVGVTLFDNISQDVTIED